MVALFALIEIPLHWIKYFDESSWRDSVQASIVFAFRFEIQFQL